MKGRIQLTSLHKGGSRRSEGHGLQPHGRVHFPSSSPCSRHTPPTARTRAQSRDTHFLSEPQFPQLCRSVPPCSLKVFSPPTSREVGAMWLFSGPLGLGFSETRCRCRQKAKMEKAGFVQEQEDHVLLPNRSPAALLHVCDPTPERPPLRLSHLRTPPPLTYSSILPTPRPREGQCRTGSSELRAHPQLRWALHLGPKPFPAAHRGEGERERETPNLKKLVWPSRTRANSDSGVLSWLQEKPSHLLGR